MLIYTGANSNYALQTAVWLCSLVRTQTADLEVVIIGEGWTKPTKSLLLDFRSPTVSIEFITPDELDLAGVNLSHGFPLATAYNILAPRALFSDRKRAFYMDADTVVTEDLADLWSLNLRHPVAAVVDAHISWMASPSMWRPWREEGLNPLTHYFNTGVLLIDIEAWNSLMISERSLEFLRRYVLPCVDQDAVNLVLRGKFEKIPSRFNSMPYHHLRLFRYVDTVMDDLDIELAITQPAIIHFHRSFFGKPWNLGCTHPGVEIWRNLADEVSPRWKRKLDVSELIRSWASGFAGMKKLDSRSSFHPTSIERLNHGNIEK